MSHGTIWAMVHGSPMASDYIRTKIESILAGNHFTKPNKVFDVMNYLDQEFNSTKYPIIVTENGISSKGNGTDEDPELNDHWRADFYHGYIGQLHRSINEDKVNVFGYTGT